MLERKGLKTGRNFGFDVPVSEEESNDGIRGYEYWLEVDAEEFKKVSLPDVFEGIEILAYGSGYSSICVIAD